MRYCVELVLELVWNLSRQGPDQHVHFYMQDLILGHPKQAPDHINQY